MALIDRIKFDSPSDDWLVWKYQTNETNREEEIRVGAQLIVNQTQEALLVRGGQALDLFGPGRHTLTTGNIPLLRKLINLPFGGQTPFTAEVWFINKHAKRNLRWGTKTPIPLIDPVYNYPVSVRAYGQWGIRVEDSRLLMTQLVGTLRELHSNKIDDYFTGEILQRLSDALSKYFVEKGVSIFQANARLNELSQFAADAILAEFKRFGLEIVNFNVESVSIPDEEKKKFQEVLGKRMEIEQVSKAEVGQAYTTARTFDVLEKAASTEGSAAGSLLAGGLGLGIGLGAGALVGQQIGQAMNQQSQQPVKPASEDPMVKLQKLKQMLDTGLISEVEFNAKKKQILDTM